MGLCDELLMEPSANQHHKAPTPYTPNITVNKIVNLEDCRFY